MDNILGRQVGKGGQVKKGTGGAREFLGRKSVTSKVVVARWDETTKDELPQLLGGPWPLPRAPAEPQR